MGSICIKKEAIDVERIDEFMARIHPLDLIVFRGGDGVSRAITKLEKYKTGNGSVSHVEVAITREWCHKITIPAGTGITDQTLLSWGSTLSGKLNDNVYDIESGTAKFGVQIRNLRDLIINYMKDPGANIGVCKLINNPITRRDNETHTEYSVRMGNLRLSLAEAYDLFNGKSYNTNILSLLGAIFPNLRKLRKASNHLFCSEFVAALYEHLGVINDATDGVIDGKIPNIGNILPVDFLGHDTDPDGLIVPICETTPLWIKI